MNRRARVVGAVVFAGALLAATTTTGAATPAHTRPHQAADHRAAVIIDTGAGVKKICIHFAEASISGLEALQRANATPVVQTFGGIGGAVCALCGRGCPAGNTCLTCGAPNYWAYFRAPAGASGFAYSRAGANSTTVHDGDVEGRRGEARAGRRARGRAHPLEAQGWQQRGFAGLCGDPRRAGGGGGHRPAGSQAPDRGVSGRRLRDSRGAGRLLDR